MTSSSVARLLAASSLSSTTRTRVAERGVAWPIKARLYTRSSHLAHQPLDALHGLSDIVAGEEVRVVEQVIRVVKTAPHRIVVVQRPCRAIRRMEILGKSPEELG